MLARVGLDKCRADPPPSARIPSVMADPSRTDALNRQFGIPGLAQLVSGNGGLPKLEVTTSSASAEIYLHGAQVTSWRPTGADEMIFLSKNSHWDDGRAIRGGIPVCFPWFRAKADDPKAPAHVGDLPHTWIAAEYVLAVRSLFAYEREADRSLIVAAGLAPEWVEEGGVQVNSMPTLYGPLSYSLRKMDSATLRFEIGGGLLPKIILRPPLGASLRSVVVDGAACSSFDKDSVTLVRTPAEVICTTEPR